MGLGAVSQLSPPATAGGAWLYKQLYSFQHPPDAYLPIGTLILDKVGNLYGATAAGGTGPGDYGGGTVFELVRPAAHGGTWIENILYSFQGAPDGLAPYSGVIRDPRAIFTAPPSRAEYTVRFTVVMAQSTNSRRQPKPEGPGRRPFSIASRAPPPMAGVLELRWVATTMAIYTAQRLRLPSSSSRHQPWLAAHGPKPHSIISLLPRTVGAKSMLG